MIEKTLLFALGLLFSGLDSFGIGANDVANSFASSVGSGSLTMRQACIIAIFTEFFGAVLLGGPTTSTIRGVIDFSVFEGRPDLLMLAMVCALVGSSTWVLIASTQGLPVSTTHSVVGAMMGVGLVGFGPRAIDWTRTGVSKIISTWLLSPVITGIVAGTIFWLTVHLILSKTNSLRRGLRAIPFYFTITIAINFFFVLYKGLHVKELPLVDVLLATVITSFVVWTICRVFLVGWLERRLIDDETWLRWYHALVIPCMNKRSTDEDMEASSLLPKPLEEPLDSGAESNQGTLRHKRSRSTIEQIFPGFAEDLENNEEEATEKLHSHATKYDPKTEYLYSFLQVLTACFASFAHGSNDVSNAVAPLVTIAYLYHSMPIEELPTAPVPLWVLVYGGLAIDLGLVVLGHRVMSSLGHKITYLSPSRGFSVELGTSLTVLVCSTIGLPVSTTHCITGATTAVGVLGSQDGWKNVNWGLLVKVTFSWVSTLPAAGAVGGCVFWLARRALE